MIEAIMNATLEPRIVAVRTQRRAWEAQPGVSGALRTMAASQGGRSVTIMGATRRARVFLLETWDSRNTADEPAPSSQGSAMKAKGRSPIHVRLQEDSDRWPVPTVPSSR